MVDNPAPLSRARINLTLQLRFELIREFGLFAVRGVRVGKAAEKSIVLQGWFRGEPVIFKKYLGSGAASIVNQACAELQFLETNLTHPFYANRCIATAPALGLIVLGRVPGNSIRLVWDQAQLPQRKEILRLVGGWLNCCIDLRSQDRPLRAQRYIRGLQALDLQGLSPEDQELIDRMKDDLCPLADSLENAKATYAVAHNDLTLMNAHYCKGEIHAVDINGARFLPVGLMAARFLVMKDLFSPPPDSRLFHGLDAADADLFLKAVGAAVAKKRIVRFFIGVQIVRHFVSISERKEELHSNAHRRVNAFLTNSQAGAVVGGQP